MLFCVDNDEPYSCIGGNLLESIFCHSGPRSIPYIDSKHTCKLSCKLVRSIGIVEQMLPIPRSTLEIPVKVDVLDVEIPPLLGLDVLSGIALRMDDLASHLWSHIMTNKDPLRFEDIWRIKFISKGNHLYVSHSTS